MIKQPTHMIIKMRSINMNLVCANRGDHLKRHGGREKEREMVYLKRKFLIYGESTKNYHGFKEYIKNRVGWRLQGSGLGFKKKWGLGHCTTTLASGCYDPNVCSFSLLFKC